MSESEKKVELKHEVNLDAIRQNGGIFLAIPMYGGLCYGALAKSLMNLASMCTKYQIPLQTHFLYNESLVQRARNYCADHFMRSTCGHFMFIDSDIEFTAQDVLVMANFQNSNPDFDVVCGPYPKKMIAWEKIVAAVNAGFADDDPNVLENFVGDYVFNAAREGEHKLSEPMEVAESGTGFMMIRRQTFEKFIEAYPTQSYKPDHVRTEHFDGSREIHAYFDCVIDPVSKRYLSEDYYFCQKIREAGMKVWLLPWIQLTHTGTYTFGGTLSALAAIGQSPTADMAKAKKRTK